MDTMTVQHSNKKILLKDTKSISNLLCLYNRGITIYFIFVLFVSYLSSKSWLKLPLTKRKLYKQSKISFFFVFYLLIQSIGFIIIPYISSNTKPLSQYQLIDLILKACSWFIFFLYLINYRIKNTFTLPLSVVFSLNLRGINGIISLYFMIYDKKYNTNKYKIYLDCITYIIIILLSIIWSIKYYKYANKRKRKNNLIYYINENTKYIKNPFVSASIVSKLGFFWMNSFIKLTKQRRLEIKDIPDLPKTDQTDKNSVEFLALLNDIEGIKHKYNNDLNRNHTFFYKIVKKLYLKDIIYFGLWSLFNRIIGLVGPIILREFLKWNEKNKENKTLDKGYLLTLCIFLQSLLSIIMSTQYDLKWKRFDMKVRAGIMTGIFNKTLSLNINKKIEYGIGKITNLITVDLNRLISIPGSLFDLIFIPIEIGISLYLLNHEVSSAFFIGILLLLLMLPTQYYLGKKIQEITKKMLYYRDKRIKKTIEMIKGIRTLLLQNWLQIYLFKLNNKYRMKEILYLKKRKYLDGFCVFFWATTPLLMQSFVFIGFIYIYNRKLSASNAFTTIALLNRLIYPMNYFPWIINGLLEAKVSATRIQNYLFEDNSIHNNIVSGKEIDIFIRNDKEMEEKTENKKKNTIIEIKNAIFQYSINQCIQNADNMIKQDDLRSPLIDNNIDKVVNNDFKLNIHLKLEKGKIYFVLGTTGSGKTGLLLSLLGEMNLNENSKGGTIRKSKNIYTSYVPQTPWIRPGNLIDNIIIDRNNLNRDRYNYILNCCQIDFNDKIINLNGSNLSGGQKQRINLARALYNKHKINDETSNLYLFDDPLSSLDLETASIIFKNLFFEKDTCKEKEVFNVNDCVVFVTHAVHLLRLFMEENNDSKRNNIEIIMFSGGNIIEKGNYNDLLVEKKSEFYKLIQESTLNNISHEKFNDPFNIAKSNSNIDSIMLNKINNSEIIEKHKKTDRKDENKENIQDQEEEEEENRKNGSVEINIWFYYIKSFGIILSITLLLSLITMQGSRSGLDVWIGYYTSHLLTIKSKFFVKILLIITGINIISAIFRSFLFAYGGIHAAIKIYINLTDSFFNEKKNNILFYIEKLPLGRMINRFNVDLYNIDETLPFILNIFLKDIFDVFGTLIILIYGNYYTLLILLLLIYFYYKIQNTYRPISRDLKRLNSITNSPVINIFTEIIDGLICIRAFKLEKYYFTNYIEYLSIMQRTSFLSITASEWFTLRLEILGIFLTSFVCFYVVISTSWTEKNINEKPNFLLNYWNFICPRSFYFTNTNTGILGLTLVYAIPIVGKLNNLLNSFIETEKQMISLERIDEYTNININLLDINIPINVKPLDKEWPHNGNIIIKSLKISYDTTNHSSLNNNNHLALCIPYLSIKKGEKIGICGKTGAGKSTFLSCLFQMLPPSCYKDSKNCKIMIDGVNIMEYNSNIIRNKLGCIPQEPIIFSGSVRFNLIPEIYINKNKFKNNKNNINTLLNNDIELWNVLEKCCLKNKIQLFGGLDFIIKDGENIFSKGEMQLFCLARILLKKVKILCIDEATSSIDIQTDKIIQKRIREEMKNATVITIAHRISTIYDNDRVFVFENGKIIESDHPHILIKNVNSKFFKLAAKENNK